MLLNNYWFASSNFDRIILRKRRQRNINKRIRNQRRRIMNRIYTTIDNSDTLSRIAQLPLQATNDQFFNGFSFN